MKTFKLLLLAIGLMAGMAGVAEGMKRQNIRRHRPTEDMVPKGAVAQTNLSALEQNLSALDENEFEALLQEKLDKPCAVIVEKSRTIVPVKTLSIEAIMKIVRDMGTVLDQFVNNIASYELLTRKEPMSPDEMGRYILLIEDLVKTKKGLKDTQAQETQQSCNNKFFDHLFHAFDRLVQEGIHNLAQYRRRFGSTINGPLLFAKSLVPKESICTFCCNENDQPYWIRLDCGHWFHEVCLRALLPETLQCPACSRGITAPADSGIRFCSK